jgi:hypothetical protein
MYLLAANGEYQPCESSRAFPGLRPANVQRFLELGRATDKIHWARELRAWVRAELTARGEDAPEARGPG